MFGGRLSLVERCQVRDKGTDVTSDTIVGAKKNLCYVEWDVKANVY